MVKFLSVGDAMSRKPVVIGPNETIKKAAQKMVKFSVGSLVVQENTLLKGIITEKDMLQKIIAKAANINKTLVNEIMSPRVITAHSDMHLTDAIKLMEKHGMRRLPVVDMNNKLVGMLTQSDITRIQPALHDLIVEKMRIGKLFHLRMH